MDEQQIKVSAKFRDDFELVTQFYECPPDEIEWLRKQARKNYEMVRRSLEEIAGNIRLTKREVA